MKTLSTFLLLAIALLVAIPTVAPEAQELWISNIEGTYIPGTVYPGDNLKFHLSLNNSSDSLITAVGFAFEIYSPGGATWDTITANWAPGFAPLDFEYVYFNRIMVLSVPPAPDTVSIDLIANTAHGIPPGWSGEIGIVEIGPIHGPQGSMIVFDSVYEYGGSGLLHWVLSHYLDESEAPSFDAVSVELFDCCAGTVGNVTDDAAEEVSLSDLTLMVNNLFVTFEEFPCPFEANINKDAGRVINLTDVTLLLNHLFITFDPLPACP